MPCALVTKLQRFSSVLGMTSHLRTFLDPPHPTLIPVCNKVHIMHALHVPEERDMLKTIEHFFKAASRNDILKHAEIARRTTEMQDMCQFHMS